jgi:hypothetical protein
MPQLSKVSFKRQMAGLWLLVIVLGRLLPPAVFFCLLFLPTTGWGLAAYIQHEQRVRVARRNRYACLRCSYDTRFNTDHCSECGEAIPPR